MPFATDAAKASQSAVDAMSRSGAAGHLARQGRPASMPAASAKTSRSSPSSHDDDSSVFRKAPSSGVSRRSGTSKGSVIGFQPPSRRSVRLRSVTSMVVVE